MAVWTVQHGTSTINQGSGQCTIRVPVQGTDYRDKCLYGRTLSGRLPSSPPAQRAYSWPKCAHSWLLIADDCCCSSFTAELLQPCRWLLRAQLNKLNVARSLITIHFSSPVSRQPLHHHSGFTNIFPYCCYSTIPTQPIWFL